MTRSTSDSGRKLNKYTPLAATLASVENAISGTPRGRATCAAAPTECANSGPKMISAPSPIACEAACCAPGAVPPSSLSRSCRFGLVNSESANSAAFRIDCAARPAFPVAESGRISPTLTWPVPIAAACAGGGGGAPLQKLLPGKPEQPAANAADPSAAANSARRVAPARRIFPCVLPDTAALLVPPPAPVHRCHNVGERQASQSKPPAAGGRMPTLLKAVLMVRRDAPHNWRAGPLPRQMFGPRRGQPIGRSQLALHDQELECSDESHPRHGSRANVEALRHRGHGTRSAEARAGPLSGRNADRQSARRDLAGAGGPRRGRSPPLRGHPREPQAARALRHPAAAHPVSRPQRARGTAARSGGARRERLLLA